jgi:putative hemolysin
VAGSTGNGIQFSIRSLMVTQRSFTPVQRRIIEGAFEIADRPLRHVLIPRRNVVALAADQSAAKGRNTLVCTGHSRAPVIAHELDDVVGWVHLRDPIDDVGTVGDHVRPVLLFPETVDVIDALPRLRTERQQIAIVINEYGGTEGIVTLEDLIEELVGEIYDETDRDIRAVQPQAGGALVLPGTFPIHDLVDLDVDLPKGDYTTVAGLLLDRLGHIPDAPGASVDINGWRLDALEVTAEQSPRCGCGESSRQPPNANLAPATRDVPPRRGGERHRLPRSWRHTAAVPGALPASQSRD